MEIINDSNLNEVQGGWEYANGTVVDYGPYMVYTVVKGDVLSGIAVRFGVTVWQLQQWNGIQNPDLINIGQKITIYR